jgi:hypothetical protein
MTGEVTVQDAAGVARRWYAQQSQPVVAAMYRDDLPGAALALREARSRLAASGLPADEAASVAYRLNFLEFQLDKVLHPEDLSGCFTRVLASLEGVAPGRASRAAQAMCHLQVLIQADRRGITPLSRRHFVQLLDLIPEHDREPEFWFNVASWAFKHNEADFLELAYEIFLTQPTEFADQYPFQRTKVMYRLLHGELTRSEVASFLESMTVLPEVAEFKAHIWPRVVAAGLHEEPGSLSDRDLADLLTRTHLRLSSSPPRSPLGR